MSTFWEKLDSFPPIVCRLLARTRSDTGGIRPLSTEEIAQRFMTNPMNIMSLSWRCDWSGLDVKTVRSFTEACEVFLEDRDNLRKHAAYIRRVPTWKYLQTSPDWETLYRPLAIAYLEHRTILDRFQAR